MKRAQKLISMIVLGFFTFPVWLFAQNEGTYIDNLGVQDSSYMEEDLITGSAQSSGSNTTILVVAALIAVAAIVFFLLKRKKKNT